MRRRSVLALLGGATTTWWPAARAQQPAKVPRIGYLTIARLDLPETQAILDGFRQGLRELGYVEGQSIIIEYRTIEGKMERLPDLAAELVRRNVDLIAANGHTTTRAARAATATIPIVGLAMTDPVGDGTVASLARPGGNVTGFSYLGTELGPKNLSLLKEALPDASRIAALWQPSTLTERVTGDMMRRVEAAARALAVELLLVEARGAEDLDSAFAKMTSARAEALLVVPSVVSVVERRRIVELAGRHGLPAMYWQREFVDLGGLMAYAANIRDMNRRAAAYVDRILKGAKPADLPIQQPTKFDFVLNLKTARELGLAIPQAVMLRADEVIE
jgi:putative ABC transport system substrate-binding protein